jgi:hypothetical protein
MRTKKSSSNPSELFMEGWGDAVLGPCMAKRVFRTTESTCIPSVGHRGLERPADRHRHPDHVPHAGDASPAIVLG